MLAITRRQVIRELLQENKSVTIADLAAQLEVTKETIRRDLRAMEKDNELLRTHGGAYILEGVQNDIDISTRRVLKTAEKEMIAEKCDALIQSGNIIFLDSSTTTWFIAQKIANRRLTVLTASLEIANILHNSPTIRLILIGGEFSHQTMEFSGAGAIRNLQQYYVDKAFISCRSISMEFGITDTNDMTATIHRIALEHAKQKFLAIDNSKLGYSSFTHVAPLDVLDGIVMDTEFPEEWKEYLERNHVRYY